MRRISQLIVAAVVVAVLLGGCSSTAAPKVLTKAEFIKKADAICASYNSRITAAVNNIVQSAGTTLSLDQAKRAYEDRLIPLFQSQLGDLRKLRPPAHDRTTINFYLQRLSDGIAGIAAAVPRARNIVDLNVISPSGLSNARGIAATYGMKVC